MDMLQLEELIRRIEVEDSQPPESLVTGPLREEIREVLDQLSAARFQPLGALKDNPFHRTDVWYH
jgi:hypothetical protein